MVAVYETSVQRESKSGGDTYVPRQRKVGVTSFASCTLEAWLQRFDLADWLLIYCCKSTCETNTTNDITVGQKGT